MPLLLGFMWRARQGSTLGLLLWSGVLLYDCVGLLVGVRFGILFALYLAMVPLIVYTLIALVARIDRQAFAGAVIEALPRRTAGWLMVGLGGLFAVWAVWVLLPPCNREPCRVFTR